MRGVHARRPSQAESRSEVFVVAIHFVANQELAGIKSGERRVPEGVGELPEVLVAQPECHRERRRDFPIVLKEVGLVELVRMENGCTENPGDRSGGTAEVVQEVGERGIARGGPERDSSQVIGAPLLGDPLLQKLHAVANGVAATEFGLCLLKKEVLAVVELCVCRNQAGRGDIRNLDLRQCPR